MVKPAPSVEEVMARLPQDELPEDSDSEWVTADAVSPLLGQLDQRISHLEEQLVRKQKEDRLLSYLRLRMDRQKNDKSVAEFPMERLDNLTQQVVQLSLQIQRSQQREEQPSGESTFVLEHERFQAIQRDIQRKFEMISERLNSLDLSDQPVGRLAEQLNQLGERLKRMENETAPLLQEGHFYYKFASRLAQRMERIQERLIALEVRCGIYRGLADTGSIDSPNPSGKNT